MCQAVRWWWVTGSHPGRHCLSPALPQSTATGQRPHPTQGHLGLKKLGNFSKVLQPLGADSEHCLPGPGPDRRVKAEQKEPGSGEAPTLPCALAFQPGKLLAEARELVPGWGTTPLRSKPARPSQSRRPRPHYRICRPSVTGTLRALVHAWARPLQAEKLHLFRTWVHS